MASRPSRGTAGGCRGARRSSPFAVWEVSATVRDNEGSVPPAAQYLQVPAGLVEAAVAFYGEYHDEIDAEIETNESEYERGRAAAAAGEQALRV